MPHAGGPFPIRYPTGAAPAVQYDDGNNGNEDDSDEDEDEDEEDTEPQDTTREYRIDSPVASPHSSSQTTTHGMQYSAPPSFGYTGTTSSFPSQLAASPAFNYATTITTPYTQRFTSPSSVNYTGSAPGYAPHSSPPQSYVSHPSTLQAPPAQSFAPQSPTHGMSIPGINSRLPARTTLSSLPNDVQANLGYQPRRFIQTGLDNNDSERLDASEVLQRLCKPPADIDKDIVASRSIPNHNSSFRVGLVLREDNTAIVQNLADTTDRFSSYCGQSLPARPILGRHATRHILAQYVLENRPTAKSVAS